MMVKSQTFALGRYRIDWVDGPIDGLCDMPRKPDEMWLTIPAGNTEKDLATCLHEVAHAEGLPDKYLDGDVDITEAQARLLWRAGWRKEG